MARRSKRWSKAIAANEREILILMKQIKIVAIIIARLTSSRLPRKHLRDLNGFPLIYHIIKRLKNCNKIDEIVLATGPKSENIELAKYTISQGVETYYDEDVNNVTGRIANAAIQFNADYIVTISGDCPLIDPNFINEGIDLLLSRDRDYVFVDHEKNKCLHEGIGIFKRVSWEKINDASETWFQKEHPGSVLKEHPELLRGVEIIPPEEFQRCDFRMSVDTLADLSFMSKIYHELDNDLSIVDLYDVVNLLDQKPWLKNINGHVHQKTLTEQSKTFLFITHASKNVGMGHISRSVALATEIQESLGGKTIFYINSEDANCNILDAHGLHYMVSDCFGDTSEVLQLIDKYKVSGIIIDIRKAELHSLYQFISELSIPAVLIDNHSEAPFKKLLSIIPSIEYSKHIVSDNSIRGKEFLILKREIQYWRENMDYSDPNGIVIMSGGSKLPEDHVLYAIGDLCKCVPFTFIIGPFADKQVLEKRLKQSGIENYNIYQNPGSIFSELKKTKLVISTFGVTVYECLALGIPVFISNIFNPDDAAIVEYLSESNLLIDGTKFIVSRDKLEKAINIAYNDSLLLSNLSNNSIQYIDGLGASRVANIINYNAV